MSLIAQPKRFAMHRMWKSSLGDGYFGFFERGIATKAGNAYPVFMRAMTSTQNAFVSFREQKISQHQISDMLCILNNQPSAIWFLG